MRPVWRRRATGAPWPLAVDGEDWAVCELQLLHTTSTFMADISLSFLLSQHAPDLLPGQVWAIGDGFWRIFQLSCAEMDYSVFERKRSEHLWEIKSPLLRSVGEVKKICWKAQNGYFLLDSESHSSCPQLSPQVLLVDTGRELETRCSQDVHALKKFCALLELYFGRTCFFLKSPASLPHFHALERSQLFKRNQILNEN